jgi:hypothetical protein
MIINHTIYQFKLNLASMYYGSCGDYRPTKMLKLVSLPLETQPDPTLHIHIQ